MARARITSRQNALVARFRTIARRRGPSMLLDGLHLVADALAAGVRLDRVMVSADVAGRSEELDTLVRRLESSGLDISMATSQVMAAVSPVRSASVIVAEAATPAYGFAELCRRRDARSFERISGRVADSDRACRAASPLVVIACDVQDPGNLGAIVRVAEAAGASGVVAAGRSADPFGWKALRGSMGSALRLPIVIGPLDEALTAVQSRHCRVVATIPRGGRPLEGTDLTGSLAVLVGGEGAGLSSEVVSAADDCVTIPMEAPVESLNAATTVAVVLYEARRQRHGLALP